MAWLCSDPCDSVVRLYAVSGSDLLGSASLGLKGGACVLFKRTFNVIMFHIWKTRWGKSVLFKAQTTGSEA